MSSSDVSSVTKYFATANEGFTTTLGSTISAGATSVGLNSTAGLTTGNVFVGIIEPGATAQQVFTGTVDVSGSQITNVVWTRGTNVGHAGGVTIVDYSTGTARNMTTAGILKQHTQGGLHSGITNTGGLTTDTLAATGNSTVGGTLGVTGTATHSGATVLTGAISGAGYDAKTLANSYKFSVYLLADQNVSNSVYTKVTLNTELFDSGNNFDSTTNYRYVAPINGFYVFFGAVGLTSAGASAGYMEGALYVNGNPRVYSDRIPASGSATAILRGKVEALLQLTAGDYVEMYGIIGDSGRTFQSGKEYSFLHGFLLSAT